MQPGEALGLVNFEPSQQGGYRRINGHSKWNTTAPNGTGKVLMSAILGSNVVAARNDTLGWASSSSSWTDIVTNRTGAGRYDFDRYDFGSGETLLFTDGTNSAATWDGSTYTLMNGASGSGSGTAPTAPTNVAIHSDHAFYLQGTTLTFSAPFAPNDFTPASGAGSIELDTTGVGLKSFRDDLYVFGEDKIYKLTGDTLNNFKLDQITRRIGCRSGFSIQEVGGDIVFLAPDGLRTVKGTDKIDDVDLGSFSKNIQPRFDDITVPTLAVSTIVRSKTQYRLFYPASAGAADSTENGIIAVFKGNTWDFADTLGIKPSSSDSTFIADQETIIHGGFDGFIYQQEQGNTFGDSGVITYEYRTPDITMGDMGIRKNMERLILNLATEGATNFTINFEYDFNSTSIPQPPAVAVTISSGTTYGSGIYGTSAYGGTQLPLARVHAIGSGFTIAVRLAGIAGSSFSVKSYQLEFSSGGRR